MNRLHNLKYLFFMVLPIIAVAVWYSPVLFKGYTISPIFDQIILGKNIAKTGMYAMENDLNIFLSSSLIEKEAHPSFLGNKLTGYLYALVFKLFGFLSWNQLILFSAILNAITLLIFAFLVFYLFNFRTSLIFSLIYIFLPFIWVVVDGPCYEFALFFISLFFLFYFLGSPRPPSVEAGGEAGRKLKYGSVLLVLSGLFLALAGLAREAFFLFIPLFFIYFLLKKEKRMIIFVFIPLFVVLSIVYLPDFLRSRNAYLEMIPEIKPSENLESNDFVSYGEFYPDPYTYHFDKENFLKEYANKRDSQNLMQSVYLQKGAVNNVKADHITLGRRVLLGLFLLVNHMGAFISWEAVGGPFIFFLMLLGLYYLKKKQESLFWLFVYLISGIIFLLSFVFLAGRNHSIDFGWILALLAALGLLSLVTIFEVCFKLDKKKTFLLTGFILAIVLYNLLLAGHTYWGRVYDNKENLMVLNYASKIDKLNISDKDVIAVEGSGGYYSALDLNYLKDKSVVVFQQGTIKKLLENDKLASAFRTFGVKYVAGYPEDLSKKILKVTNVVNISSSDAGDIEEFVIENNSIKSWLMNLIK